MVVVFEQHLKQIFTFNRQREYYDYRMSHIFRQEARETVLYTITKDMKRIERKVFPDISKLINFPEQYDYEWQGIPQSVFFKSNNCYYIFG